MEQNLKYQLEYLNELRMNCKPEFYNDRLGQFLYSEGFHYPECEDVIQLYLDYALITQDFVNVYKFTRYHQVGKGNLAYYHFFFHKFKQSKPDLAHELLQDAKYYIYSDFEQLAEMKQELDSFLLAKIKDIYLKDQQMGESQVALKMKEFVSKKFQSKSKRLVIAKDDQCKRHSTSKLLQELQNLAPRQVSPPKVRSIFQKVLNPEEEQEKMDLIGLINQKYQARKARKSQLPLEAPKTPSGGSAATQDYFSKMPSLPVKSVSSSSDCKDYIENSYLKENCRMIITIPNVMRPQYKESKKRVTFQNIQKIRMEDPKMTKSTVKEQLEKISSPQI